jgi:hypothetical protein
MVTRFMVVAASAVALLSGCSHPPAATTATAETPLAALGWVTADQIPAPAGGTAAPSWRDGRLHPSSTITAGSMKCAAGWILPGPNGSPVMLTARHCEPEGTDRVSVALGPGDVGVWESAWEPTPSGLGDVAAVRLTLIDPSKVDAGEIAGVLPAAEVAKLAPHTTACAWLPNAGTVCGEISSGGDTSAFLSTRAPAKFGDGDSGSPVWTLDRDGKVVAIGVLSTTLTDDLAKVALIEPAVRAYNLKLP